MGVADAIVPVAHLPPKSIIVQPVLPYVTILHHGIRACFGDDSRVFIVFHALQKKVRSVDELAHEKQA